MFDGNEEVFILKNKIKLSYSIHNYLVYGPITKIKDVIIFILFDKAPF